MTNHESVTPKWLVIFGPNYLAYKGYLKAAFILFLISFSIQYIIVNLVLNSNNAFMTSLFSLLIVFSIQVLVAMNWDFLKNKYGNLLRPNGMSRFANLSIFFTSFILISSLFFITKNHTNKLNFERAFAYKKDGKLNEAKKEFLDLCKINKGEACYQLAEIHSELAEDDEAIKYWKQACTFSKNAKSCLKLGDISLKSNENSQARSYYGQACLLKNEEGCLRAKNIPF